jgi:hypothetical protein
MSVRRAVLGLAFARLLSVLGHPALLMPLAVWGAARQQNAPLPVLQLAVGATVLLALCVGLYSVLQVRAGRWQHVDASVPRERRQLNVLLVVLLWGAAAALAWAGQARPVVAGLALGGAIVLLALALGPWLKLSLHGAFALLAGALLWPSAWAWGVWALAAGVACSRVVLRRHTRAEVLCGAAAGALAGLLFHTLV